MKITEMTPAKGKLLLEIFDRPMEHDGFKLAGDTETSEFAIVIKKGSEGNTPMPYQIGDEVIIQKFHGRKYREGDNVYIPIDSSQVLMYGKRGFTKN